MKGLRGAEGHGQVSALDGSLDGTERKIGLMGAKGRETRLEALAEPQVRLMRIRPCLLVERI